ncbi:Macrolide export ATP-binding/permease protein MacB [Chromobacterium violaceum]|uniref:Macrolide export ATP-binding/permease protein MacB n=1 Tax=Chromobacterium violaceum TaxID=536 RepID=A0A3S4LLN5_CHRVL|nr:Macrolide export ATP-binding/permease protein MacB [Chromobacterium violaceum]
MSRRNAEKRLALIGCGTMGTALGLRLLGLGWEVRVYNRSPERTAPLRDAGASAHATPAEAVAGADWVATVLTDSAALRALLFGDNGIASAPAAGRRLVDLGTHQPTQLAALGAEAAAAGWPLVEAPMTGSVHDAATAPCISWSAARRRTWSGRARCCGRWARRPSSGRAGRGQYRQAGFEPAGGVMAGGLGEAIALLRAHGLAVDSFLDALDGSGLASPLYRRLGSAIWTATTRRASRWPIWRKTCAGSASTRWPAACSQAGAGVVPAAGAAERGGQASRLLGPDRRSGRRAVLLNSMSWLLNLLNDIFINGHAACPFRKTSERFMSTAVKPSTSGPIVELQDAGRTFLLGETRIEALRHASLAVQPGDFLAIWGPSGSGKSTLLNLLGLIDSPSYGRMLFRGRDVAGLDDNALSDYRSREIGFVFQNFNLIPVLSALET